MKTVLIVLGVLLALKILRPVLVLLLGKLFGGWIARMVGQRALAQQPDAIHLTPADTEAWTNPGLAATLAEPMLDRGFEDAGSHAIAEMPGVLVRLLAYPKDSTYAAIYEHPQAGTWFDFVARYADGNSATFTTSKESGMTPRPGHTMVHTPGTSPQAVYARMRGERPAGTLQTVSVERAVRDFEQSYVESIAWRKRNGISAREVAEVAERAA